MAYLTIWQGLRGMYMPDSAYMIKADIVRKQAMINVAIAAADFLDKENGRPLKVWHKGES